MGELHLDVLVDRMKREFSVEANIGKPQVAYRETITQTVEIEGKYAAKWWKRSIWSCLAKSLNLLGWMMNTNL